MHINNKFLNKIAQKIIGKHYPEELEWSYMAQYGFNTDELMKAIHIHFCNLLFEIYNKCPILEIILCSLCELEMYIKHIKYFSKDGIDFREIPTKTLYCSGCPYGDCSEIARFVFGSQSDGYCHYLNKGDFSYVQPTDLLWDGCKECGVGEDFDDEEEYSVVDEKEN